MYGLLSLSMRFSPFAEWDKKIQAEYKESIIDLKTSAIRETIPCVSFSYSVWTSVIALKNVEQEGPKHFYLSSLDIDVTEKKDKGTLSLFVILKLT